MSVLVRVVVATTEGPSTVLRVTEEDPAVRSVVCLGRTTTALPISRAYDAFVRSPTGVVERAVGHPAFRVDVSAPIDDGDSWQLGLYLAHRLKAAGRLAEDGVPAGLLLWVTGAVDGDLAVRPVERVADKRRRSAELFEAAAAGLIVVMPAGQEGAFGDPPEGAEVLAVDRVVPVLRRLGLADAGRPPRRRRTVLVAAAAAAVALTVAVAVLPEGVPPGAPPPDPVSTAGATTSEAPPAATPRFASASVRLAVLERRPVAGTPCNGEERLLEVDPGTETPSGVCGIAARAINDGDGPGFVWLVAVAEGTFREYAGQSRSIEVATGALAAGETAEVRVSAPSWIRRPLVFRVLMVLAAEDRQDVSRALAAVDTMSIDALDRLTGQFVELGLDVRTVRHRVLPRA